MPIKDKNQNGRLVDDQPLSAVQFSDDIEDQGQVLENGAPEAGQKYEYRPSQATLDKLNKMPKDDLAKEFGIHLDDYTTTDRRTGEVKAHKGLISSANKYGLLEDLASGVFTRVPIRITEKIGHKRVAPYYAIVKFMPSSEDGAYSWSLETRPINFRYKLDENGNRMYKPNGEPDLAYERPEVRRDQIVKIGTGRNEKTLSAEQQDMVRLLGVIEGAVVTNSLKPQIWMSNEYDPSVLVPVNCDFIGMQLDRKKNGDGEFVGVFYEGKDAVKFKFNEKNRNEWMQGRGDFITDEKGRNRFLRFNPMRNSFYPSVSFNVALENERKAMAREKAVRKAMAEGENKGVKKSEEQSQERNRGMR